NNGSAVSFLLHINFLFNNLIIKSANYLLARKLLAIYARQRPRDNAMKPVYHAFESARGILARPFGTALVALMLGWGLLSGSAAHARSAQSSGGDAYAFSQRPQLEWPHKVLLCMKP